MKLNTKKLLKICFHIITALSIFKETKSLQVKQTNKPNLLSKSANNTLNTLSNLTGLSNKKADKPYHQTIKQNTLTKTSKANKTTKPKNQQVKEAQTSSASQENRKTSTIEDTKQVYKSRGRNKDNKPLNVLISGINPRLLISIVLLNVIFPQTQTLLSIVLAFLVTNYIITLIEYPLMVFQISTCILYFSICLILLIDLMDDNPKKKKTHRNLDEMLFEIDAMGSRLIDLDFRLILSVFLFVGFSVISFSDLNRGETLCCRYFNYFSSSFIREYLNDLCYALIYSFIGYIVGLMFRYKFADEIRKMIVGISLMLFATGNFLDLATKA